MLRVNEKFFREALCELKQCDYELYNHIEQTDEVLRELSDNSSLEEERVRLKQILSKMENIQHNVKSMVRVLDYAAFEYGRCENNIVLQCEQTALRDRNSSRFNKIIFNVPFSENIGWRKGEQDGNKF